VSSTPPRDRLRRELAAARRLVAEAQRAGGLDWFLFRWLPR
jgi:hypothetical protein